jgi:hypothetical protein
MVPIAVKALVRMATNWVLWSPLDEAPLDEKCRIPNIAATAMATSPATTAKRPVIDRVLSTVSLTAPPPVDPAPVDPAPVDPPPVDPAPVDPAPVGATSSLGLAVVVLAGVGIAPLFSGVLVVMKIPLKPFYGDLPELSQTFGVLSHATSVTIRTQ